MHAIVPSGVLTGRVPVGVPGIASGASKSTTGIRASKPGFLWVTVIDNATATSAWMRPSLRAATAMRV